MAWTERLLGWIDRFVSLGVTDSDSEQERAHKATLTLIVGVTVPLVLVWTIVYGALGLLRPALIPFVYGAVSAVGLVVLARTGTIRFLRLSQLTMWLLLPFFLQWSLGGFANSSAVAMWALGPALLAYLIGARPWPWLAGLAVLSVVSGVLDSSLSTSAPEVPAGVITGFFVLNFLGVALVISIALRFFIRRREADRAALAHQHHQLELSQEKSEQLLLNILPAAIAQRLKDGEEPIADGIPEVTVLLADIVGFTPLSEKLTPAEVVELLNELYSTFDDLADGLGIEKIKTVGDAYVAVGGLPPATYDHAAAVAELALSMRSVAADHYVRRIGRIELRIGLDMGPVVAGVIGKRRFSFGIWGDAINTASRMESHGVPGRIQVTERLHARLADRYRFEARGPIPVKGKGDMATYFLEGPLERRETPAVLEEPTAES